MTVTVTPRLGLSVDRLLGTARQATGLSDFGPPSFLPGLERLVEAINALPLTALGARRTEGAIVGCLIARLGVWDHRTRDPAVAQEQIRTPMFVVGLPRSGTTLLFGLLAQDPDHRVPMLWETTAPCPPPETATYDTDPRIELVTSHLHSVDGLNPRVLAVHPIGAELPQECIGIFAMEFQSYLYYCSLPIRGYNDWVDAQDQEATYRWHRLFLQHLQSRHRKARWVLKAPSHMEFLGSLFATYPDALIVNTHRSPIEAITSHASLHWHLWEQSLERVDRSQVGPEIAEMLERWVRRFVDWRAAHPALEERFVDVHYESLVADPIACVRSIYARFGLPVSPQFESGMERFLQQNRQDKFGRHHYAPEDFGLGAQDLAARFRFYTDRFDVPIRC